MGLPFTAGTARVSGALVRQWLHDQCPPVLRGRSAASNDTSPSVVSSASTRPVPMLECRHELGAHRRHVRDIEVSDGFEESASSFRGWKPGCAEQLGQLRCPSRKLYAAFGEHADQVTGQLGRVVRTDGLKCFSKVGRRVGQILNADHGVGDELCRCGPDPDRRHL